MQVRAGREDLNLIAERLNLLDGKLKIGKISEEHGIGLEVDLAFLVKSPLLQKFLPAFKFNLRHRERSDGREDLHLELGAFAARHSLIPDWTVRAGAKILETEWVQKRVAASDLPLAIHSASEVTLLLQELKEKLDLPFDFEVGEIIFGDNEVTVHLTVIPDQNGM